MREGEKFSFPHFDLIYPGLARRILWENLKYI